MARSSGVHFAFCKAGRAVPKHIVARKGLPGIWLECAGGAMGFDFGDVEARVEQDTRAGSGG